MSRTHRVAIRERTNGARSRLGLRLHQPHDPGVGAVSARAAQRAARRSPALAAPLRTASPPRARRAAARRSAPTRPQRRVSLDTMPSTGTISPGRTNSRSPGATSSIDGEVRFAPSTRCTSLGTLTQDAQLARAARPHTPGAHGPVASITVTTAPARYSPTASVPMTAKTAITSTPESTLPCARPHPPHGAAERADRCHGPHHMGHATRVSESQDSTADEQRQ